MDKLKYVKYGKTLEEYKRKYGKYHDLISFSQEQVDEFFKKWGHDRKGKQVIPDAYLITERKWWFIENRYYEVPKLTRKNNLIKAAILLLLLCGIGGATIGTLAAISNNGGITEVKKYKVTYHANGGIIDGKAQKTIEEKETIQVAPNATRDGYVLEGWYKSQACPSTDKISFPYTISSDTTIFAKWVEKSGVDTAVVMFDSRGGSAVTPMYVAKGSKLSDYGYLPTPERENYEFLGWSYKQNELDPYDPAKPINEDLTLYAHHKRNVFNLTFATIGEQPAGTEDVGTEGSYKLYKYNKQIKSLNIEPVSLLRDQETGDVRGLKGWKLKDSSEYITYPFKLTGDTTIYSEYAEGPAPTYNCAFYDPAKQTPITGGTFTNVVQISTPPTEVDLLKDPDISSYHNDRGERFVKWVNKATRETINFSNSGGYLLSGDTEFEAVWEKCKFTVNFVACHGNEQTLKETRNNCGIVYEEPSYYVENYEIQGWYDNPEFKGKKIDFNNSGQGYKITKDTTFYGKYTRSNYKVQFQDEKGTEVLKYNQASKLIDSDCPALPKVNHKLNWQYYNKSQQKWVTIVFSKTPTILSTYLGESTDPLVLKASYTKVAHTLTLEYPDDLKFSKQTLDEQTTISSTDLDDYKYPSDTKVCTGWSYKKGGEIIKEEEYPITLVDDTTLYAIYETRVYNLTIDYIDSKGTKLSDQFKGNIEHGVHPITEFKKETIAGYTFSHWVCNGEVVVDDTITVKGNITLKAVYSKLHDVGVKIHYFDRKGIEQFSDFKTLTNVASVKYSEIADSLPAYPTSELTEYVRTTKPKWQYRIGGAGQALQDIEGDVFVVDAEEGQTVDLVFSYERGLFDVDFQDSSGTTVSGFKSFKVQKGSIITSSNIPTNEPSPQQGETVFNGWGLYDDKLQTEDPIDFDKGYEITESYVTKLLEAKKDKIIFRPMFDRPMEVDFMIDTKYQGSVNFKKSREESFTNTINIKNITKVTKDSYKETEDKYEFNYLDDKYEFNYWVDEKTSKIKFPITDGKKAKKELHALFEEKGTTKCTVLLNSGNGTFDDSGTKELMLSADKGTTLDDFISKSATTGYKVPKLLDHKLKYWMVFDQSQGNYVPILDNKKFIISSTVILYPEFEVDIDTTDTPVASSKFTSDNWATIGYWADQGEAKLLSHYSLSNRAALVKLERNVRIDGTSYNAKIVGVGQDSMNEEGTQKALLTWTITNTPITSIYNLSSDEGHSNNWETSALRRNLNSLVIYNRIDEVLSISIKSVCKKTRLGQNNSTTYNNIEISLDQYFLFSCTELGFSKSTYSKYLNNVEEGAKYDYIGTDLTRKINGSNGEYRVRSPINSAFDENDNGVLGSAMNYINSDGSLHTCDDFKTCGDYYTDHIKGVIFGFCVGEVK